MQQMISSMIGSALGTGISGMVIGSTAMIWQNRKHSRKNIAQINEIYGLAQLLLPFMSSSGYFEVGQNTETATKAWRNKEMTKQEEWIKRPFYRQFREPPAPI